LWWSDNHVKHQQTTDFSQSRQPKSGKGKQKRKKGKDKNSKRQQEKNKEKRERNTEKRMKKVKEKKLTKHPTARGQHEKTKKPTVTSNPSFAQSYLSRSTVSQHLCRWSSQA
jgi:hypothetical protein